MSRDSQSAVAAIFTLIGSHFHRSAMALLAEHILQPGLDDAQVLGMVSGGELKAAQKRQEICTATVWQLSPVGDPIWAVLHWFVIASFNEPIHPPSLPKRDSAVCHTVPDWQPRVPLPPKAVDFLLVAGMAHSTIAHRYRELACQVHPDKLHGPGSSRVQFACWLQVLELFAPPPREPIDRPGSHLAV